MERTYQHVYNCVLITETKQRCICFFCRTQTFRLVVSYAALASPAMGLGHVPFLTYQQFNFLVHFAARCCRYAFCIQFGYRYCRGLLYNVLVCHRSLTYFSPIRCRIRSSHCLLDVCSICV